MAKSASPAPNDKLHQIDSTLQRQAAVTQLDLPTFTRIAGRTSLESSERSVN